MKQQQELKNFLHWLQSKYVVAEYVDDCLECKYDPDVHTLDLCEHEDDPNRKTEKSDLPWPTHLKAEQLIDMYNKEKAAI